MGTAEAALDRKVGRRRRAPEKEGARPEQRANRVAERTGAQSASPDEPHEEEIVASWVWEVPTGKMRWAGEVHRVLGCDDPGGTWEEFLARVHEHDRARLAEAMGRAAQRGTGFCANQHVVLPDGGLRHTRMCGQVIGDGAREVTQMVGICLEIAAEREDVAALRESERSLRRLLDGARDYAIYLLDADGRIVSWNSGAARLFQYGAEEVIGHHYSMFNTEEDRDRDIPAHALATAAREGRCEGEGWRVRKDGSRYWASTVVDAIRDEDGELVGFAKVSRDLTDKREAQIALDRARSQLAETQRMESIGQLTGGVAHDFNNLLTVVIGNLETLRRQLDHEWPDAAKMRHIVESALRGAQRGASLTQQLLAFSRSQRLHPTAVRPATLLAHVSHTIRRRLGTRIAIATTLPAETWCVEADAAQLEGAILNLAANSYDAMQDGGQLTIGAENVIVERHQEGRDEVPPGQYVVLTVRDTGKGMPPDVLSRVFEPFYTTKGLGHGTGLGLPQVYGFVKQSGGHVKIESEAGRGTTVHIYLPRCERDADPGNAAPAPAPDAGTAGVTTILLVEDDEDVRAYSNDILQELGYRVMTAADGREALGALDRHPEIRLLFTDIGLPGGMSGSVLAAEARRRRPGLVVLLTTAYAGRAGEDGRIDPATPVIAKPFTSAALAEKLNDILGRAGQR